MPDQSVEAYRKELGSQIEYIQRQYYPSFNLYVGVGHFSVTSLHEEVKEQIGRIKEKSVDNHFKSYLDDLLNNMEEKFILPKQSARAFYTRMCPQ